MLGVIRSLANYSSEYEETDKTESLIFVVLCVLCFSKAAFKIFYSSINSLAFFLSLTYMNVITNPSKYYTR